MKDRIIAIFLLLLAAVTVWAIAAELPKKEYAQPAADFTDAVREGNEASATDSAAISGSSAMPSVSDEVIRLHILADSDSEQDQNIKLALRDVLLPYLNAATLNASTKEEALTQLTELCASLTEIANNALGRLGVAYTASISVERIYFPIRIYGSQTYLSDDAVVFPPGFYDSVQVVLGSGEGHNWWCLAYPSLCFIDSSYDYIPKDSDIYKLKVGTVEKGVLEKLFYGNGSPRETDDNEITLYLGSRLWELLKNLFH